MRTFDKAQQSSVSRALSRFVRAAEQRKGRPSSPDSLFRSEEERRQRSKVCWPESQVFVSVRQSCRSGFQPHYSRLDDPVGGERKNEGVARDWRFVGARGAHTAFLVADGEGASFLCYFVMFLFLRYSYRHTFSPAQVLPAHSF